ncbi:hypothetical protein MMPV_000398 [Pyropia vietnamensis]
MVVVVGLLVVELLQEREAATARRAGGGGVFGVDWGWWTRKPRRQDTGEASHSPKPSHGVVARLSERTALLATYALPTPYLLAACTVARDADDVLREWVLRNFLAGIDHFFLYDDTPPDDVVPDKDKGSGDNGGDAIVALLGPLSSLVTVLSPPGRRRSAAAVTAHPDLQRRIYWDCATRYGPTASYITHLDTDEYLEPRSAAAAATIAHSPAAYAAARPGQAPFLHASLWALARRAAKAGRPPPPALWGRWTTVLSNGRTVPPPAGTPLAVAYPAACTAGAGDWTVRMARLVDWKPVYAPATLNFTALSDSYFVHGTDSAGGEYQHAHIPPWGPPPRPPSSPRPGSPTDHPQSSNAAPAAAAIAAAEGEKAAAVAAWRDHGGVAGTPATDWEVRHYWSRSLVEYALKAARGRPNGHPRRSLADLYAREAACAPARARSSSGTDGATTSPPELRAPLVRALLGSLPPPPPLRGRTAAVVAAIAGVATAEAGNGTGGQGNPRRRAAVAAAAAAARSVVLGSHWCGGIVGCAADPLRAHGWGGGNAYGGDGVSAYGNDGDRRAGAWKMAHLLGQAAAGVALNASALCTSWGLCDGRDAAAGVGGGRAPTYPYAWMRYVDDGRLGPEDVEWLPPGVGEGIGA